jgi:hypothetical protein
MNRREGLGLAALGQENNPAAQVADRASSIRIRGMKAYGVNSHVFLRIETNEEPAVPGNIEAFKRLKESKKPQTCRWQGQKLRDGSVADD